MSIWTFKAFINQQSDTLVQSLKYSLFCKSRIFRRIKADHTTYWSLNLLIQVSVRPSLSQKGHRRTFLASKVNKDQWGCFPVPSCSTLLFFFFQTIWFAFEDWSQIFTRIEFKGWWCKAKRKYSLHLSLRTPPERIGTVCGSPCRPQNSTLSTSIIYV